LKLVRALVLSLSLVATGLAVMAPPAAAAPVACPESTVDAVSAVASASACGEPVEVSSKRSEYSQTFANPDGTWTLQQYVEPRFAKTPSGQWEPVDTTLRVRGDVVAPARSVVPMEFSAGGTGVLARLVDGTREVGMTWPGRLPAPTLSGNTATYPEVLPGIDLQLTATPVGFSEVLVVKSRAAAKNAALAKVRFGLHTKGVTVSTREDGSLQARDGDGRVVFQAPTPTMWDSSGAVGGVAKAGGLGRLSAMRTEVDAQSLSVVPDAALLTDPEAVFPIYIDPGWTGRILDNMWKNVASRSDVANSTSFTLNNGSTNGDAGAGRTCDSVSSGNCLSTEYLVRSFFRMNISGAFNRHFLSATFNITQKWSWTCNPKSNAKLWITGGISASTTWNNQPSWQSSWTATTDGNRRVDSGAGCGAAGTATFNVTAIVAHALASGWSNLTLGLRAVDESTRYQWKRFQSSTAALAIQYNSVPGTPVNLSPHNGQVACGGMVGTTSPVLRAQFPDADGSDTLTTTFAWEPVPLGGGSRTEVSGGNATPGGYATRTLSLGDQAEGRSYRFQVRSSDGIDTSPWSDWCTFTVDVTIPSTPNVTASAWDGGPVYAYCDPANVNECTPTGSAGVPGVFTFSEPAGYAGQDVISYTYGWTNPPTTTVTVSPGAASPPIPLTPPRYGLNHLYVFSKDGSNKQSATRDYTFLVGAPSNAVAHWPLDSIDSHGFTDQIGGGSLSTANVTWTPDARYYGADAATFADGEATQLVPALDTSGSFAVSAWTRLASTCSGSQNRTAVAIDADTDAANNHVSAFLLSYDCGNARWRLRLVDKNVSSPWIVEAVSANNSVVPGRWTHVVGSYDEAENTIRLWLDGVLVSSVTPSAGWVASRGQGWQATGPVTIGRDRFNDNDGGRFQGEIADVRVWSRALVDQDIAGADVDLPNGVFTAQSSLAAPRIVGEWFISDGECWCVDAADGSGFDRRAYLVPNWRLDEELLAGPQVLAPAWFVDGGHDSNGALRVDGVAGYASTTEDSGTLDPSDDIQHAVVHTDQSLTFSAWVNVNQATNVDQVVVAAGPVALLARGSDHKWAFTVTSPNGSGGSYLVEAVSNTVATTGSWVHLVGVFSAATGTVSLYVDGVKQSAVGVGAVGGASQESVTIGALGPAGSFLGGYIDDVRIFQGALNDREVREVYQAI